MIRSSKIILTILVLALPVFAINATYTKITVDDPAALCLDGSPGAYYLSIGEVQEKVVLHFEGGGWCGSPDLSSTIESCYQRSKSFLGSSKPFPFILNVTDGILSNSPSNDFRSATKVLLLYCDGAGHQGYRANPLPYKDANLYFRGTNITIAQLNSLEDRIGLFSKAKQILVTGASAGGLAALTWINYIKDKASTQRVYVSPDSGIFLDAPTFANHTNLYRRSFQNLLKISNTDANPPTPECISQFANQPEKCMFAQNLFKHIKAPIFAIQSLYDAWSIPYILGIQCLQGQSLASCNEQQLEYIQEYHRNTTNVLQQMVSNPQNGFWAPACSNHVYTRNQAFYSPYYRVPANSENSIDSALLKWVIQEGDTHRYMDSGNWPINKPCSGVQNIRVEE